MIENHQTSANVKSKKNHKNSNIMRCNMSEWKPILSEAKILILNEHPYVIVFLSKVYEGGKLLMRLEKLKTHFSKT